MPVLLRDILTAMALLTRLSVPGADFSRSAKAAWAWPLVGVLVGIFGALVASALLTTGLPAPLAAGLALAAMIAVTGAMHEDGLADSADGLWGGWDRERRLAIMRDSQIGTYGVLALIIAIVLRWVAFTILIGNDMILSIIVAAILSRTAMVPLAFRLPHARDNGLSVTTGRPRAGATFAALVIGAGTAVAIGGSSVAPALVVTGVLGIAIALIAKEKIGGQTGDILGANQQITEIGILLTFVSFIN